MFNFFHLSLKTTTTLLSVFLVFVSFSQTKSATLAPESSQQKLYKNELTFGNKEKELYYMYQSLFTSFKNENIQMSRVDQLIVKNKYYKLVPNAKTLFKLSRKELVWLINKDYDDMFMFHNHLKKEFINNSK